MRRLAWRVVIFAVVVAGAACSREERLTSGQARLVPGDDAQLSVGEAGDARRASPGIRTLARGTRVRVSVGTATILFANGDRIELGERAEVRLNDRPVLLRGEVLLVPGTSRPLTIAVGGSTVAALGPARVTRDLAVTAASYRTGLRLESAGKRLRVAPLRQVSIASLGEVPDRADPIVYRAANPWDRLYLGDAVKLAGELETRSRGFTASLARGDGRTTGFYRLLLPALEGEADFNEASLETDRPAGENLVGIAIALQGRGGSFRTRFREVFDFREAGASWGLVALDQGVVEAPPVMASVDQAIGRAPLAFAPPPSTRPQSPPSTSSPGPGPVVTAPPTTVPAPTVVPGRPPIPDGTGATGGTGPVAPPPTVAPPSTPPPVLTPLTDLLAGLLPGVVNTGP
ncbi:MAG: hypothetical protein ABIW46_05435 [Acidimicrobiales bacterium]